MPDRPQGEGEFISQCCLLEVFSRLIPEKGAEGGRLSASFLYWTNIYRVSEIRNKNKIIHIFKKTKETIKGREIFKLEWVDYYSCFSPRIPIIESYLWNLLMKYLIKYFNQRHWLLNLTTLRASQTLILSNTFALCSTGSILEECGLLYPQLEINCLLCR